MMQTAESGQLLPFASGSFTAANIEA